MQIEISERLKPFSHKPGTACVIPGSFYQVEIFPAFLRFYNLTSEQEQLIEEIALPIKGPVKEFTIQLDLEKQRIMVWGKALNGYFRYIVKYQDNTLYFFKEKGLEDFQLSSNLLHLTETKTLFSQLNHLERLSLGNHKAQDWELVARRLDLKEILPAWLKLGQLVKKHTISEYEGTLALLKDCQEASKNQVIACLENLFQAGFSGLLSPQLIDKKYQGFNLPKIQSAISPLALLSQGADYIRSLFVEIENKTIKVLHHVPSDFHCGRFINIQCNSLGSLDIEWTKKMIRRLQFTALQEEEILFQFSREIKSFRLNGKRIEAGTSFLLKKGRVYFFDNFQK